MPAAGDIDLTERLRFFIVSSPAFSAISCHYSVKGVLLLNVWQIIKVPVDLMPIPDAASIDRLGARHAAVSYELVELCGADTDVFSGLDAAQAAGQEGVGARRAFGFHAPDSGAFTIVSSCERTLSHL